MRKPSTKAPTEPKKDARAALWPRGQEGEWGGRRYTIRPWSLSLLFELSERIPEKMTDLFSGDTTAPAATLIPKALSELRYMVARTLNVSEDEVGEWPAEDLLDAGCVMADVCVLPLQGKMMALALKVVQTGLHPTPRSPAGPSPAQSNSSSPGDIL